MGGGPSQATAVSGARRGRTKARITVVVRKRPLTPDEVERSEQDILAVAEGDASTIRVDEPRKNVCGVCYTEPHEFIFDRAYAENHTNLDIYSSCVRHLVDAVFEQGARCTCFAYGQTGSGKTYTMVGRGQMSKMTLLEQKNEERWDHVAADPGLLELASHDCFRWLQTPEFEYHYGLYVSFYEIYCNKVYDLLNRRQLVRALEANSAGNVVVKDLKQLKVDDVDTLLRVISSGLDHRIVGMNSKNTDSSRGHAILTLEVKNEHSKTNSGKLVFVDLAGSERGVDAMGSGKQTQTDGAGINRSLLALKECIRALDLQSAHVPFRDSELTKVLRDMFVGSTTQTLMISCVSPSAACCEQTLNTLRYADRVKAMRRNGIAALGLPDQTSGSLTSRGSPPAVRLLNTARCTASGALSARGATPHLDVSTSSLRTATALPRKTVALEEPGGIRRTHGTANRVKSSLLRHSVGLAWHSQALPPAALRSPSTSSQGSLTAPRKQLNAAPRSAGRDSTVAVKRTRMKTRRPTTVASRVPTAASSSLAFGRSNQTHLRTVTSNRVLQNGSLSSPSSSPSKAAQQKHPEHQQHRTSFFASPLSSSFLGRMDSASVVPASPPLPASSQRAQEVPRRVTEKAKRLQQRGCTSQLRVTGRKKADKAAAPSRPCYMPPLLILEQKKVSQQTRMLPKIDASASSSGTNSDDARMSPESRLPLGLTNCDSFSVKTRSYCKYFPPREKDDLLAAARLLRKRYREWNFPLIPEDTNGEYLDITTTIKMLKGIAALPAQEVHNFYEHYHGKMERFYNDLVLCHRDGVQTEVRLNEVQQQMLTGLQKPLGGSALATFELDLDYLTDLRSVVETQLSMAIRLGKRVAEMERMLSLQKTLIAGYQSASASEAEFYAKPQWQQPSPSLEAVKATSGCAQRVSTTPKHTEAVASGPNFLATATADSQRAPSPVNVSTAATTPGDVIAVKEVHDVSTESSLAAFDGIALTEENQKVEPATSDLPLPADEEVSSETVSFEVPVMQQISTTTAGLSRGTLLSVASSPESTPASSRRFPNQGFVASPRRLRSHTRAASPSARCPKINRNAGPSFGSGKLTSAGRASQASKTFSRTAETRAR